MPSSGCRCGKHPVRWIVDTSAWSRLNRPEVKEQLEELLAGDEDELVLSPAVELELMREPQGGAVAAKRRELEEAMEVLAADAETFSLAADAMERLADHHAEAHRRPIADLITAALAHQHDCGVVHLDGDFELLAEHSGLEFEVVRVQLYDDDEGGGRAAHPAAGQRALKTELAQLVHQLPIEEPEAFLEVVVAQARERVERPTGS